MVCTKKPPHISLPGNQVAHVILSYPPLSGHINTLDSRGVFGSANNATCILRLDNAFVCIQSLHLRNSAEGFALYWASPKQVIGKLIEPLFAVDADQQRVFGYLTTFVGLTAFIRFVTGSSSMMSEDIRNGTTTYQPHLQL